MPCLHGQGWDGWGTDSEVFGPQFASPLRAFIPPQVPLIEVIGCGLAVLMLPKSEENEPENAISLRIS